MSGTETGFTIVELTITIAVIGIVAASLTQLFISIGRIQQRTSYLNSATHAAQTEIESLRNGSYNSLTPGQSIDFSSSLPSSLPNKSGTVAVSEPLDGLRRVDVTVSFTDGGTTRNVVLSSLIGVIGITQ